MSLFLLFKSLRNTMKTCGQSKFYMWCLTRNKTSRRGNRASVRHPQCPQLCPSMVWELWRRWWSLVWRGEYMTSASYVIMVIWLVAHGLPSCACIRNAFTLWISSSGIWRTRLLDFKLQLYVQFICYTGNGPLSQDTVILITGSTLTSTW